MTSAKQPAMDKATDNVKFADFYARTIELCPRLSSSNAANERQVRITLRKIFGKIRDIQVAARMATMTSSSGALPVIDDPVGAGDISWSEWVKFVTEGNF